MTQSPVEPRGPDRSPRAHVMTLPETAELLPPRIAIVDDEPQIHASLRLRLGQSYELTSFHDARSALEAVGQARFDLCFVDIHMPDMDGLAFIESARLVDPELGYVVLSAFDTGENLRRAIPLQVIDFIGKPFPERHGFEALIPEWIARTRSRRREQSLARKAGAIHLDLDSARQERDVELVASETARDALLQTANLLTTINGYLVGAMTTAVKRAKTDPDTGLLLRHLVEAQKTATAAASIADKFFDSAYASRDSSPALIDAGLPHAVEIARRMTRSDAANKAVDFVPLDARSAVRELSGIDFLLLMVPALAAALTLAPENTTVGLRARHLPRLEDVARDPLLRRHLWVNRKHALVSQPGVLFTVTAAAPALSRSDVEGWLRGEPGPLAGVSPRGLIAGVQKSRGLLAFTIAPSERQFELLLALPA